MFKSKVCVAAMAFGFLIFCACSANAKTLDPEIPSGERLVYRINDANHQKIFGLSNTTTVVQIEGEKYYRIDGEIDDQNETGAIIRSRDFAPVSCYYSYSNPQKGDFWLYSSSWDLKQNKAVFHEASKFSNRETNEISDHSLGNGPVYDFYVHHLGAIRGIDLQAVQRGEKASASVFINKAVGILKGAIKLVKEEEVSVPAGRFRCLKVKLEPELNPVAYSLARVLSPQGVDSFFWVTVDKPHMVVKLEMAFAPLGEREMILEKVERVK